ncbi:MAG: hypothetical protein QW386_02725 [Candidatus Bathyarchaeia archaeon]
MTNKHKLAFKLSDIQGFLEASEMLLDAMEQFITKHELPEMEVKLKCRKKTRE